MTRAIPQISLALLHRFEQGPGGGFAAKPYRDPGGAWTIGWGHKIADTDPLIGSEITLAEADALAAKDLARTARYLHAVLDDALIEGLTEDQWAALIDFTFNEGIGRFEASTMRRLIESGDVQAAGREFEKWIYVRHRPERGLIVRRSTEAALWTGAPSPSDGNHSSNC